MLKELLSVTSMQPGVYRCLIRAENDDGSTEDFPFVAREDDPHGLGPQVWEAVQQWIADGRPVNTA